MYQRGTHQTNGVTVNNWMRGIASAGNAIGAPATTVSRNISLDSLSNGNFLQQMNPNGTVGGFVPALQAFATPMVSTDGLIVSPRDSTQPRPFQVYSNNRPQTVLPPPSPAPNFFAGSGNVFSRGGRDNFGSNFGQRPVPAANVQQLGQHLLKCILAFSHKACM